MVISPYTLELALVDNGGSDGRVDEDDDEDEDDDNMWSIDDIRFCFTGVLIGGPVPDRSFSSWSGDLSLIRDVDRERPRVLDDIIIIY